MKNKCNCYRTIERLCYTPFFTQSYYKTVGICNGTKERDECSCGGDRTKCDFYPEVRKRARRETEIKNPITNADNLRSMNDKELAEFLMSRWFIDDVCKNCEGEYDKCGDLKFCKSKVLEWLLKGKGE